MCDEKCGEKDVCFSILDLAISSVKSIMRPRRGIKQNILFKPNNLFAIVLGIHL
jgi:hypothetical protein